jgi:hypothetical protein
VFRNGASVYPNRLLRPDEGNCEFEHRGSKAYATPFLLLPALFARAVERADLTNFKDRLSFIDR